MNPLAVVLDTNVIVAAMRSRQGCSFKIIDDFMTGKTTWEWNVSNSCVLEYEEVLLRE
jgi:predicted nucleic acid-binding protein